MTAWIQTLFRRVADRPLDWHQVGDVLKHYLDGQIDAATARRIEAHLELVAAAARSWSWRRTSESRPPSRRIEALAESIARLHEFTARLARGEAPSTP